MKANEAPEKLYLDATSKCGNTIFTIKNNDTDIEYTRTDVFINKAADWLNNFYNEDTHSYLIDEDIEKFINYMRGE